MQTKACHKCSFANVVTALFCGQCGNNLKVAAARESVPPPPVRPLNKPAPPLPSVVNQPAPPAGQPLANQPSPPSAMPMANQPAPPVGQPLANQPPPGSPMGHQPPPPAGQPSPQPLPNQSNFGSSGRKKPMIMILGGVILLAILIVGGLLFFLFRDRTPDKYAAKLGGSCTEHTPQETFDAFIGGFEEFSDEEKQTFKDILTISWQCEGKYEDRDLKYVVYRRNQLEEASDFYNEIRIRELKDSPTPADFCKLDKYEDVRQSADTSEVVGVGRFIFITSLGAQEDFKEALEAQGVKVEMIAYDYCDRKHS